MNFRKIFATDQSGLIGLGLLVLRVAFGALMMNHGIDKLSNFSTIVNSGQFMPVLGSVALGLGLDVFAEVFMSVLLIIGLFTRIATIPLIVTMLVAVFLVHLHQPFANMELALLYLFPYIALLLAGPGKFSIDFYLAGQLGKKRKY
jgi:Predicted membrane protein